MNYLLFLAVVYFILAWFGVSSPSKELHLALAYLLCRYDREVAHALDPATLHRLREHLAMIAKLVRGTRVTISAGDFAWRWPRR